MKKVRRVYKLLAVLAVTIALVSTPGLVNGTVALSAELVSTAYDSYQQKRLIRIAKDVFKAAGPEAKFVKVEYSMSPQWNAYATSRHSTGQRVIVVHKGILTDLNDDELATIIGHELAHHLLAHIGDSKLTKRPIFGYLRGATRKHQEKMADYLGHYLAVKAGYNPCAAHTLWSGAIAKYGDYIHGKTHPSPAQRQYYFKGGCEK